MASKKKKTEALRRALEANGPVYVRALIPDYASKDWELGNYGAWYIGHVTSKALEDEEFAKTWKAFQRKGRSRDDDREAMDRFAEFLEERGYLVFGTMQDGTAIAPVDGGNQLQGVLP